MERSRNWLGWLGIGLGILALLIAVSGWNFGLMFAGGGNWTTPPSSMQQNGQLQNAPQDGRFTPNSDNRTQNDRQHAEKRGGGEQRGGNGWNLGRWFSFPWQLFDMLRNLAILAVLVLLGLTLLRNRGLANRSNQAAQTPTQAQNPTPEQRSPTGESYKDE